MEKDQTPKELEISFLESKIEALKNIVFFRGVDHCYDSIITIAAFSEHGLYQYASEFKEKIIAYYQAQLDELRAQKEIKV